MAVVAASPCRLVRAVDISAILPLLGLTTFVDTGGTNGWLAEPEPAWLRPFVASLALDGVVAYAVCRKLPAWQGIPPHVDRGSDGEHRYHVPLVTDPRVTMRWPKLWVETHLEAGYLYEVDFTALHEIVHRAPIDRIHIQINVVNIQKGRS